MANAFVEPGVPWRRGGERKGGHCAVLVLRVWKVQWDKQSRPNLEMVHGDLGIVIYDAIMSMPVTYRPCKTIMAIRSYYLLPLCAADKTPHASPELASLLSGDYVKSPLVLEYMCGVRYVMTFVYWILVLASEELTSPRLSVPTRLDKLVITLRSLHDTTCASRGDLPIAPCRILVRHTLLFFFYALLMMDIHFRLALCLFVIRP